MSCTTQQLNKDHPSKGRESVETTATRVFLEQNHDVLAQHCEKASLISKFQMLILSISS